MFMVKPDKKKRKIWEAKSLGACLVLLGNFLIYI